MATRPLRLLAKKPNDSFRERRAIGRPAALGRVRLARKLTLVPRTSLHKGDAVQIEVELAGGHRLRIRGSYDPEALARLLRGLSG